MEIAMAMTFAQYQKESAKTDCIYPRLGFGVIPHIALALAGEAGEVAELVKKYYCGGPGEGPGEHLRFSEFRDRLVEEAGDCLWYLAALARILGIDLEKIAERNLEKLADRYGKQP